MTIPALSEQLEQPKWRASETAIPKLGRPISTVIVFVHLVAMLPSVVLLLVLVAHANAIGENAMDLNTITGIIGGIGKMLDSKIETINIPAEMIMGKWFQMYKAAMNFDIVRTQMYCPVAYFNPNPIMGEEGFSMEEAYRVVSKTGPIETYKRDMNKVGPGQYWMYTEEYFYPRQFYVIGAGPSFDNETLKAEEPIQYLIVSDANRLSLMVYARDPLVFFQKYNKPVVDFMQKHGFGGNVFWNSPKPIYQGPDCEWPSEKEVFTRRVLKNQEMAQRSKNGTDEPVLSGMPLADMIRDPKRTLERLVGPKALAQAAPTPLQGQ
ncbi:unnamed protein product [Caenorhabditis auriculariae]|uniref:Uncharacterized protein n=1 Tax=Caenorhabditis auriculariae TaxID=2777116 RepID=A0A8S1H926_9PELO|nr:unnamed protein product [Caenorhabditis auriculariae]